MTVIVHYYATCITQSIENVKSVQARTNDNCLIIDLEDGSFQLINMLDGKVNVKVVNS